MDFFPKKNSTTHTQEVVWDSTVARLDPATPISRVKIKMGSRMMFSTAPSSTEAIAMTEKPWVRINGFKPWLSMTNTVPQA